MKTPLVIARELDDKVLEAKRKMDALTKELRVAKSEWRKAITERDKFKGRV